jgi:hypothetical protein
MSAIDSSMSSDTLAGQIGIAVAVKAKHVAEAQGAAVLSLLDSAMEVQQNSQPMPPHLGAKLDVRG